MMQQHTVHCLLWILFIKLLERLLLCSLKVNCNKIMYSVVDNLLSGQAFNWKRDARFLNDVSSAFSRNKFIGTAFLYHKKTIDTLDHVILLRNILHYGFQNDTCEYYIRESVFVFKRPELVQTSLPWRETYKKSLFERGQNYQKIRCEKVQWFLKLSWLVSFS